MTDKDPNLIKTPINETVEQMQTPVNTAPVATDTAVTNTAPVNNLAANAGLDTHAESATPSSEEAGELVNTEHVNEGDLEARSPDRRDQVGQPFDGSINEESFGKDSPQSEDLTTFNRYANVDNAQTRILSNHEQLTNHDD